MDIKILVAKACTLLYQESRLASKVENSADLVRTVLDTVQVSEVGLGLNTEREVITALKSTLLEMCDNGIEHEYDRDELLQRLRVDTSSNDKLYDALCQGINDTLTEAQIKRMIGNIRKSITNHFREQQINDTLSRRAYTFK